FVTRSMGCTVMDSTKWYSKFIARLAAQGAWLRESQVMGVRRLAAAQKAGMLGNKPKMLLVAVATRHTQGQSALVDPVRQMRLAGSARLRVLRIRSRILCWT